MSLSQTYLFRGRGDWSLDATGGNFTNGGTILADVPVGSRVEAAYLYASTFESSANVGATLTAPDGSFLNLADSDFIEIGAVSYLNSYRTDVTDFVRQEIGNGAAEDFTFSISQLDGSFGVDGYALAVVYSNPLLTTRTVALLDGGSNQLGDSFVLNFANPLDTSAPGFEALMSLGIGFGFQPSTQSSVVTVNGRALTSSAGGYDDGAAGDGALITIGGIGDDPTNPANPGAGANVQPTYDDELYDLSQGNAADGSPFLPDGSTFLSVATRNDSQDDIIFFAGFNFTGLVDIGGSGQDQVFAISNAGSVLEGDFGSRTMSFSVQRTGTVDAAGSVDVTLAGGGFSPASSADVDGLLPRSQTLDFAAGERVKTVTLSVLGDDLIEANELVVATLSNATASGGGTADIARPQGTGTIVDDDRPLPPPPPANLEADIWGDPHLVTFDGLAYDFQAAGEFVLVETADPSDPDPLMIQVRTEPLGDFVSVTTAMATMLGTARVSLEADGTLRVNGTEVEIDPLTGPYDAGGGLIYKEDGGFTLVYPSGEQTKVALFGSFMTVCVFLDNSRPGTVQGLLGDGNGERGNDLALRNGTELGDSVDFATLYGEYAESWRVSDATSLFDYAAGQGTEDFTDRDFPNGRVSLEDLPAALVEEARDAARAAGLTDPAIFDAAALDFLLTGNADFIATATILAGDPSDELLLTDAPAVVQSVGISSSVASFLEGNSGSAALQFTVYRTGDATEALTVNYRVGGDVDADDFGGAVPEGEVTFAAGETVVSLVLDVTGDVTPEDDEELQVSLVSADVAIASTEARTLILNDDGSLPGILSIVPVGPDLDEGDSGQTIRSFRITREGSTLGEASVTLTVAGVTANAQDFAADTLGSRTVSFGAGEASVLVDIAILGDTALEEDESFTLSLSEPVGAEIGAGSLTALILNDDSDASKPVIRGTPGDDTLEGTAAAEILISGAGRYDRITGGGGADEFVFGSESSNGTRERNFITDYEVGVDSIHLVDGAEVVAARELSSIVALYLGDDRDALYIFGDGVSIAGLTLVGGDIPFV